MTLTVAVSPNACLDRVVSPKVRPECTSEAIIEAMHHRSSEWGLTGKHRISRKDAMAQSSRTPSDFFVDPWGRFSCTQERPAYHGLDLDIPEEIFESREAAHRWRLISDGNLMPVFWRQPYRGNHT